MTEQRKYDEDRELPSPWEWVIITLFSAAIVAFGIMVYYVVREGPRQWDFGQLPDTPAESIYSTEGPGAANGQAPQLPLLPEAEPQSPVRPQHQHLRERTP